MNFCKCGHGNPEEAVFCGNCGSKIDLDLTMGSSTEQAQILYCAKGHHNPPESTFCGKCGINQLSVNNPKRIDFYSLSRNFSLAFVNLGYAIKSNTRRVTFLSLITVLIISLIVIGISFQGKKIDYESTDVLTLLGNNDQRVTELIEPSCQSLVGIYRSAIDAISEIDNSVKIDYRNAFEYQNKPNDFGKIELELYQEIRNEIDAMLANKFEGDISKIKYPEDIKESIKNTSFESCEIGEIKGQFDFAYSALQSKIEKINAPGFWQPAGFTPSQSDPNIAYRFLDVDTYEGPGSSGWTMEVVTRLGCVSGVKVFATSNHSTVSPSAFPLNVYKVYVQYDGGSQTGSSDAYCD